MFPSPLSFERRGEFRLNAAVSRVSGSCYGFHDGAKTTAKPPVTMKHGRTRGVAQFVIALLWPIALAFSEHSYGQAPSNPPRSTLVERTIAIESQKVGRIGVYINLKRDCTSSSLPVLRLVEPPHDGKVTVKLMNVRVTNLGACLSNEVPGLVAFYQSRRGFEGIDKIVIEIKYPGEAIRLQTITINVRAVVTRA